jgi:hypothetical protein
VVLLYNVGLKFVLPPFLRYWGVRLAFVPFLAAGIMTIAVITEMQQQQRAEQERRRSIEKSDLAQTATIVGAWTNAEFQSVPAPPKGGKAQFQSVRYTNVWDFRPDGSFSFSRYGPNGAVVHSEAGRYEYKKGAASLSMTWPDGKSEQRLVEWESSTSFDMRIQQSTISQKRVGVSIRVYAR